MPEIVTKAEFARRLGIGRSAVGNMVRRGQLTAPALVERGGRVLVDETVARRQLRQRLDVDQRLRNGRLGGDAEDGQGDTLDAIQRQKLTQLELANARDREAALARSGRYMLANDARQEMGKIAGALIAAMEGGLPELADAIAADIKAPQRDVLLALKGAWRALRARLAYVKAEAAQREPECLEAAQ